MQIFELQAFSNERQSRLPCHNFRSTPNILNKQKNIKIKIYTLNERNI